MSEQNLTKKIIFKEAGILLVDDETWLTDMLAQVCRDAEFKHVFVARNGLEAMTELQRHSDEIDLIAMDFMMPEMNGIQLAQAITNSHQRIVGMIMVTGYPSNDLMRQFLASGSETATVEDFIPKPFDISTILNSFEKALKDVFRKRQVQVPQNVSESIKDLKQLISLFSEQTKEFQEELRRLGDELKESRGDIKCMQLELQNVKAAVVDLPKQIGIKNDANTRKTSGDLGYVWALAFVFLVVTGVLAWASVHLPILSVLALAAFAVAILILIAVFDLSKGGKLSEKSLMEVLKNAFQFIGRRK